MSSSGDLNKTKKPRTKEPQYQRAVDNKDSNGATQLGILSNQTWQDDPRHLVFVLARYKFISKMLSGKKNVLEVGCGDSFGTSIVRQEVEQLLAIDFDPILIKDGQDRMGGKWQFEHRVHDILSSPVDGQFDAAYAVDVLEHIPSEDEGRFMSNIIQSLDEAGVLIIGTPTIQSQVYASEGSKEGHINCKDDGDLKNLMLEYFHNVFIFSMNDEVVHTGFYPMAHYLFALCVGKK
jgi:2-polyprenyl-3-methyl-5-hydroxy-6-metoxy-1,4-benzoquinol methylase